MRDDGFRIEEVDDERTIDDTLIPDCEAVPFTDENELSLPVLEYVAEFKALIDACGWVSYYYNMKRFLAANANKAKIVASSYNHDLRYYNDQLNTWREKARRSFDVMSLHAKKFGFIVPNKNDFLNSLTLYKTRRDCYKYYIGRCLKTESIMSPKQLEQKFAERLNKRLKRKE